MATFEIHCLERFEMETVYQVTAPDQTAAIDAIRQGKIAYTSSTPTEGEDEFIAVRSVERLEINQ